MIYCKEQLICFVLVPKTGTTSLRKTLANLPFKVLTGFKSPSYEGEPIIQSGYRFSVAHPKFKHCVETYPNLRNYKYYGVYRDPVDRFLSAAQYLYYSKNSKVITQEEMHQDVLHAFKRQDALRVMFEKQIEWLDVPNITVIDFKNYEQGILDALKDVEGEKVIYRLNENKTPKLQFSQETLDYVKNFYKDDYDFAKDKLSKSNV